MPTRAHKYAFAMQVTEKCPSCGHMEAFSKEMQLRSADEGSTILYTVRITSTVTVSRLDRKLQCVKCRHGWRVNN